MKKFIWIIGVVLLVAAAAGGGFFAGKAYQQSLYDQAQANFIQARGDGGGMQGGGMFQGGEFPADRQMPFGGGGTLRGGTGGGVMGTVKSLDGNTLTLSTAEDVTRVILTDETVVQMTVTGTPGDLAEGLRLMVTGERDTDGSLTATLIQIVSSIDPAPEITP